MPNFDGGHYFLTALFPIRNDTLVRDDHTLTSPAHLVVQALAVLPKGQQSRPSEDAPAFVPDSPFARSRRTHFARLVLINDTIFNGRTSFGAIRSAIDLKRKGITSRFNPTIAQHCDQLRCPYLLFVADFDADGGDARHLRSYLAELWGTMEKELTSVFQYCLGFAQVKDAASFADFVANAQLETTMPFNDYWADGSPFKSPPLGPLLRPAAIAAGLVLVVGVAAAWWAGLGLGGWIAVLLLALVLAIAAFAAVAYRTVMRRGPASFPAAPRSDLRSILKALYLQRKFQDFVVRMQGQSDETRHRTFGEFLAQHAPGNADAPTQAPGVVK
jgi:hypothetical protein